MKQPRSTLISDLIPELYRFSFDLHEPFNEFGWHIRAFARRLRSPKDAYTSVMSAMEAASTFFMIADEIAMATENVS